ncbi:unnamed protein product, partial [Laminaria digitata]
QGGGHVAVPSLPPPVEGAVYTVRGFSDLYVSGRAWDGVHQYSVPSDDDESLERAIVELARRHASQDEVDPERRAYFEHLAKNPVELTAASRKSKRRLLKMLLLEIPEHFTPPATLLNSFDRDKKELAAWKDEIRNQLMAVIVLAILVGLAILTLLVLWGIQQARYKQRLLHEVDLELATQDLSEHGEEFFAHDALATQKGKIARAMAFFQGAVVFGTLILFAVSILLI